MLDFVQRAEGTHCILILHNTLLLSSEIGVTATFEAEA